MSDRKKREKQSKTVPDKNQYLYPIEDLSVAWHHKKENSLNSDEMKEMFKAQQLIIQGHERTIESLQIFKKHIAKGLERGIFDKEENEWVEDELKRITDLKTNCQNDLSKKENLYLNSILKLENLLEERRIAIENAENESCVFEQCPRLLQRFAEKRANLIKLVDKGKQNLQE